MSGIVLWMHYEDANKVDFTITLLNHYLNDDQVYHFAVLKDGFRGELRE